MRTEIVSATSAAAARRLAPWATKVAKVSGGYLAFESVSDFETWSPPRAGFFVSGPAQRAKAHARAFVEDAKGFAKSVGLHAWTIAPSEARCEHATMQAARHRWDTRAR